MSHFAGGRPPALRQRPAADHPAEGEPITFAALILTFEGQDPTKIRVNHLEKREARRLAGTEPTPFFRELPVSLVRGRP